MGVKILRVSTEAFLGLISPGEHHYETSGDLPKDARILHVFVNKAVPGEIDLLIGSGEFSETDMRFAPSFEVAIRPIESSGVAATVLADQKKVSSRGRKALEEIIGS